MAKKKKYPRRIDAIKAYLRSLFEKEEKLIAEIATVHPNINI